MGLAEDGNRSPLEIQATKTLTITEVSIIQPAQTYNYSSNYTVEIFNNDNVNGTYNCGGCTPANSKSGITNPTPTPLYSSALVTIPYIANSGPLVRQLTLNATLPAGKYWIRVNSTSSGITHFTNDPAFSNAGIEPVWNTIQTSTGAVGLNALMAHRDNSPDANSHLFNIKFQTGTGYTCGRILVCQAATACPLPVNLLYFTATKNGAQAELNWATAGETNSSYFNVQRSTDGINWYTVGKVAAAGNSSAVMEYSFIDSQLPVGIVYYKIVEVDLDNSSQSSEIAKINTLTDLNVSILPNPNNGNFTVQIQGNPENTVIAVVNTLGQTVYEKTEEISSNFSREMNFSSFSKGIYYLSVKNSTEHKIVKIILE